MRNMQKPFLCKITLINQTFCHPTSPISFRFADVNLTKKTHTKRKIPTKNPARRSRLFHLPLPFSILLWFNVTKQFERAELQHPHSQPPIPRSASRMSPSPLFFSTTLTYIDYIIHENIPFGHRVCKLIILPVSHWAPGSWLCSRAIVTHAEWVDATRWPDSPGAAKRMPLFNDGYICSGQM